MKARTRAAFTLVELLTVIAIIGLLISLLLPALGRAREMGHRAACSANQASIMKGLLTYAAGNQGQAPNWGQVMPGFDTTGKGWDWNGTDGGAGTYSAGPYRNATGVAASVRSNTRNYYILVRNGLADPKNFVCNSDNDGGQPFQPADPNAAFDFQHRAQVSFSLQYVNPAATTIDEPTAGYTLNMGATDPRMVMIADKSPLFRGRPIPSTYDPANGYIYDPIANTDVFCDTLTNRLLTTPGTTIWIDANNGAFRHSLTRDEVQNLNSLNHRGEGQNVARLDGSVAFAENPWQGPGYDNIWTVQDSGDPASQTDAIASATPLTSLIARVAGVYPGGATAGTNQTQMLQQWMATPTYNKSKYPDSFLVP